MTIEQFIEQLRQQPESVEFEQTMALIEEHFYYQPVRFTNGAGSDTVVNEAGSNEGSCRLFAFARLAGLDEQETLACFGKYYREDVLAHPQGHDHANIRHFMRHGWAGIHFDKPPLSRKQAKNTHYNQQLGR